MTTTSPTKQQLDQLIAAPNGHPQRIVAAAKATREQVAVAFGITQPVQPTTK
jgi:hypothetical protein